jgi:hypothetical protein
MSDYGNIKKWLKLTEKISKNLSEEVTPQEKLDQDLQKTDSKLMQFKLDKLNMLLKRKYYETSTNLPEDRMFQFHFADKGDHYEFTMPLNILFGKKTRDFCAKYWDDFFSQADISTTFSDNIAAALKQTGGIHLTMKLNKKITKEVQGGGGQ